MEMGLANKVAIVTGGAGSIGQGICEFFTRRQTKVVINDFGKENGVQDLISRLQNAGGQAIYVDADITNAQSVSALVQQTLDRFGGLHFLVNCAGVATAAFVKDMTEDEWDFVVDINLKGTFLSCRAVLPTMIEGRFGRIVNIASLVSRQGSYKHAHYCASKAGVIGFTQSLAKEVGEYGITANCISPGRIKSTMEADRQRLQQQEWISQTPMGRMGVPGDIAAATIYLCSDQASFVTGETLNVNGGIWMG